MTPVPPVAETETDQGRRVLTDRLPAIVHRPDGELVAQTCRVVLTDDELYVWSDRGGQPRLEHRHPLDGIPDTPPRKRWEIATSAGVFTIDRVRGDCGCASALKRFVPWAPYRMGRR